MRLSTVVSAQLFDECTQLARDTYSTYDDWCDGRLESAQVINKLLLLYYDCLSGHDTSTVPNDMSVSSCSVSALLLWMYNTCI